MKIENKTIMGATQEDLGGSLHTALRKFGDSAPTSLAWNLINLCNKGWSAYLKLAWKEFEVADPKNCEQAAVALKKAAEELPYANSEFSALRLSFSLFTVDDWEAMCALLETSSV